MTDCAEDSIESGVQMFAEILGEEAEDEDAVLLKPGVLAPVAAIGRRVGKVLGGGRSQW